MVELDIQKTRILHQWKHDSPLLACRISPTATQCVSTAQDFSLQRWGISTGDRTILKAHDSWVHALTYSADGSVLVSGGCDGRLVWWPISEAEPKPIRVVEAHAGWIRAVERSSDSKTLVSVGNDRIIRLWNIETGEKLAEWPAHERHIYSAAFHPDGVHLATGDLLGKVCIWKLADHSLVRTLDASPLYSPNQGQAAEFGGIRTMAINASGTELITAGTHKGSNPFGAVHEPLLLRFSWTEGTLLKTHVSDGIPGGLLFRACCLQGDTVVAVSGGSSGGILLFYGNQQDKELHRFALPNLARDLDANVANGLIATAHFDHHLRISAMFAA
jgi:WD40 repeat protein